MFLAESHQTDFHLQWWLFTNEDHNSHDPTLLHNVIKLRPCFIVLIERHRVTEITARTVC